MNHELARILELAGTNTLYVSKDEITEADWRKMRPDSAFGDNPDAAASLRYHLEQAERYAHELGNHTIETAINSFLEISMDED